MSACGPTRQAHGPVLQCKIRNGCLQAMQQRITNYEKPIRQRHFQAAKCAVEIIKKLA